MSQNILFALSQVGLSATLPNYIDVGVFLSVPPKGLLHFDSSYRPVPLDQNFIGIIPTNSMQRMQCMNELCYQKVANAIENGHQAMVFVHSRKDTTKTARFLRDRAAQDGKLEMFLGETSGPKFGHLMDKISKSRNRDLKELGPEGFGMHNAGMTRPDRNIVEGAFQLGVIKVC